MEEPIATPALSPAAYAIRGLQDVLTPALAVYSEFVENNIRATLRLLDGEGDRWRPHVKTAKLGCIMQQLVASGVTNFKCATTLELRTACRVGARDVLVAYPLQGANALRVREIAAEFPRARVSVLVDSAASVAQWSGSGVGIFVDVNPGMDRTGIARGDHVELQRVMDAILQARLEFRGIHYYDGHLRQADLRERTAAAHRGYDELLELAASLEKSGTPVTEIVTSGTPTLPCALSYARFRGGRFEHRVSPGTVVYGDSSSIALLPEEYGYRQAVLVVSRVVSHPAPGILTADAGHKAVSADAGVPTCAVLGRPELVPRSPSEEHLPIEVPAGALKPAVGEFLYLLPRHVCPTVNNFDEALIVARGKITRIERVTARGRETPLLAAVAR
ncbi:MAG TPA: alanine racemase [Candidatus Acidoferrales bacterium]|nr:alanine racemase [Candidatus Acidoferrales bacterium]